MIASKSFHTKIGANSHYCDILNYMVTPSDHQCTNDGGNFIFINQSINSRCVCRDPYYGVL